MKKYTLTAIALAAAICALSVSADEVMQIKYNRGTTTTIKVTDIQDMTFTAAEKPAEPEAIDLGLPSGIKWASCNLGGDRPADLGLYYSWGEVQPKEQYDNDSYRWTNMSQSELQGNGIIDAKGNLTPQYDAASCNWGIEWRMPTLEEIAELINKCNWEQEELEGRYGVRVTGPNGNSIFLPFSGYRLQCKFYETIYECDYWSSTFAEGENVAANSLFSDKNTEYVDQCFGRCGFTIRPVTEMAGNSLPAPAGIESAIMDNGIGIEWCEVDGATSYKVYRSENGTDYVEIGATDKNYFLDESPVEGLNYYAVRAVAEDGSLSPFCYLPVPMQFGEAEPAEDLINGHKYVDLGLPSGRLWADCNLGAESPSDYGNYYIWGELVPTSQVYEPSLGGWSFQGMIDLGAIDASGNLTGRYDAARHEWGVHWRIPSLADIQELVDNCTHEWTSMDGHYGDKFTGPNGNSIFIPAAGITYYHGKIGVGEDGKIWCSTLSADQVGYPYALVFNNLSTKIGAPSINMGISIRPVAVFEDM